MEIAAPYASKRSISLDKKTPQNGYMVGNVVFCTFWINTMKGRRTEAEFYSTMELILARARGLGRRESPPESVKQTA